MALPTRTNLVSRRPSVNKRLILLCPRGKAALGGVLNQAMYRQPPPASTGPEKNGLGWANSHLSQPTRPILWPPWWSVLLWGLSSPARSDLPVALLRVILNKRMTRQPHRGDTFSLPLCLFSDKYNLSLLCKNSNKNKALSAHVGNKGRH